MMRKILICCFCFLVVSVCVDAHYMGYNDTGIIKITASSPKTIESHIRLKEGGVIAANDPESGYHELVTVTSGDTMDLDDDLIAGGTRTGDTWYYVGIAADSDGVEPPRLVAGTQYDTPGSLTQSDLPTGYELFASLGTVRSGWIRTDGSSNLYEQEWDGNRNVIPSLRWRQDYRDLLEISSNSSPSQLDLSDVVPPAEVTVGAVTQQPDDARLGIHNSSDMEANSSQSWARTAGQANANGVVKIHNIENQTIWYAIDLYSSGTVRIRNITQWEVTGN